MPTVCSKCRKAAPPGEAMMFCLYCGGRMVEAVVEVPESVVELTPVPSPQDRRIRHLGSGSMGDVYEVDRGGSRVAVKYLSAALAAHAEAIAAFREEARTAGALNHPCCVNMLAFEEDPPRIVMELMPGRTLKDAGRQEPSAAVRYGLDLIDGLAAVHGIRVVHRDVKPGNCFLTADDRVKLGDFGLSSKFGRAAKDSPLGTVLFASPEQLRGEQAGFDSDQYSACATLYFLLCGRAPHESTSVTAALAKAMSEPAPPLASKGVEVAPGLEKVVLKGLDRNRGKRWPNLEKLRKALEPFAGKPDGGVKRNLFGRLFG